jgi:hypothetical protein
VPALPRGDDDFRLALDTAISALFRDGWIATFFLAGMPESA